MNFTTLTRNSEHELHSIEGVKGAPTKPQRSLFELRLNVCATFAVVPSFLVGLRQSTPATVAEMLQVLPAQ